MSYKETAMANLSSSRTGLPNGIVVYVSVKDSPSSRHAPRVKISNVRNSFNPWDTWSIGLYSEELPLVAGKPKNFSRMELDAVRSFLLLNRELLLNYWNAKIGFEDLLQKIKDSV